MNVKISGWVKKNDWSQQGMCVVHEPTDLVKVR